MLIVSPHFPPVNAPDMQRVRMSLPRFVETWDVTVLTVDDPTPMAPIDSELNATIPPTVAVERVHCCSRHWTRRFGIGNVALRAFPFLAARGARLLSTQRYDVVYFSTTMFSVLPLGVVWRALTGVPFVVDLQDPWVTDYYERPGAPRPPGGWKYGIVNRLSRLLEGWTLRAAAHLIIVSGDYRQLLRQRYAALRRTPFTELPFGSPDPDLDFLRRAPTPRRRVLPSGGLRLAFVGAIGPGMRFAVAHLLAGLRVARARGLPATLHCFGTSYAGTGSGQAAVLDLAQAAGVADAVTEQTDRLGYLDALQVTLEADVNLILGSTDLGFTPSKIMAVLAAGKPVLSLAPAGGAMARRMQNLGAPAVELPAVPEDITTANAIAELLAAIAEGRAPKPSAPAEGTARRIAERQLEILAAAAATRRESVF